MAIRIAGGQYRSRVLKTPAGQNTRPTKSMVREAVFNILQGELPDSQVLDLFAGSGAMGFEALSRGAEAAVFCDAQREAIDAIRQNAQMLGCREQTTLLHLAWQAALRRLGTDGRRFDLIFLDPPYKMSTDEVLSAIKTEDILAPEGMIILEQGARVTPSIPEGLDIIKQRQYGDSAIYVLQAAEGTA